MHFLPTLVLAAAATTSPSQQAVRSDPVLVRNVIDGDTIDVAGVGRVRLLGIDAPEVGRGLDTSAPFAREARERLAALVLRHWVRLEGESQERDAYNRRLAYVLREDGVFVNAVLVREGLARVNARVPLARLMDLQSAEREAQMFRRGMWGQSPSLPLETYRSRRPKVAPKTGDRYTAKSEPVRKARKGRTARKTPGEKRRRRAAP